MSSINYTADITDYKVEWTPCGFTSAKATVYEKKSILGIKYFVEVFQSRKSVHLYQIEEMTSIKNYSILEAAKGEYIKSRLSARLRA
jgi:hypothetical protein